MTSFFQFSRGAQVGLAASRDRACMRGLVLTLRQVAMAAA